MRTSWGENLANKFKNAEINKHASSIIKEEGNLCCLSARSVGKKFDLIRQPDEIDSVFQKEQQKHTRQRSLALRKIETAFIVQ